MMAHVPSAHLIQLYSQTKEHAKNQFASAEISLMSQVPADSVLHTLDLTCQIGRVVGMIIAHLIGN